MKGPPSSLLVIGRRTESVQAQKMAQSPRRTLRCWSAGPKCAIRVPERTKLFGIVPQRQIGQGRTERQDCQLDLVVAQYYSRASIETNLLREEQHTKYGKAERCCISNHLKEHIGCS